MRLRRVVFTLLVGGSFAACGIDSVGIPLPNDGGGSGPDATRPDGTGGQDGARDAIPEDTGTDAGLDGSNAADADATSPDASDASGATDASDAADARDANGTPTAVRANINGPAHIGIDYPGLWRASPVPGGVCGNNAFSTSAPLHNTNDPELFQGQVFGDPVVCTLGGTETPLSRGRYRVRLYFAEIHFGLGCPGGGGVGSRVFDVFLENTRVLDDFDILTESNGCIASTLTMTGHPVIKEFEVLVNDGSLNISMSAKSDYASLSALEVIGPL